jgi:post-segregation antitoxin (ccd killing protein)
MSKKHGGVTAALAMPSEPELQDLVKATMLDFNAAVQSGDFTSFHKKAAKKWQEQNTADEMKDAFKEIVDNKENFNLKGVSEMKPTFEPAPTFEPLAGEKALSLSGWYATTPKKTQV